MLQIDTDKVYIEHCQSCSSHSWCTKHDESKYLSYYENCKAKILVICPEIQVVSNQIPLAFSKKFTETENSRPWEGKHSFPRIGAFEIYFKDKIIFSKLETGMWPQSTVVANSIREYLDQSKLPPVQREIINTNILKKRRKAKVKVKEKKTSKSIEPSSSRNQALRVKSTTPNRRLTDNEHLNDANYPKAYREDHSFAVKRSKKENSEEDYSDDFKEDSSGVEKDFEEKNHEEARNVTKVYELSLPSSKLSNKVKSI